MVRREKSNYVIQSVSHALDVLEQFHANVDEIGVTELSKRLKLHKNNVFRLLATLEARGYIEQKRSYGKLSIGFEMSAVGSDFYPSNGFAVAVQSDSRRICPKRPKKAPMSRFVKGARSFRWISSNRRARCAWFRFSARFCRRTARPRAKCIWFSKPTASASQSLPERLERYTDKTIVDRSAFARTDEKDR